MFGVFRAKIQSTNVNQKMFINTMIVMIKILKTKRNLRHEYDINKDMELFKNDAFSVEPEIKRRGEAGDNVNPNIDWWNEGQGQEQGA